MANVVEAALQGLSTAPASPGADDPREVPVRAPRSRSLVRTLLQGDALKADARQFFRRRQGFLPDDWEVDRIVEIERVLEREPGYRSGGFLGLLRYACDLFDASSTQTTLTEARLWFLLRKRLSSSSGLMLLRSVANAHDTIESLLADPEPSRRRGFCDILRVLGARTGKIQVEHPRLIDRAIWEFALLLSNRADQANHALGAVRTVTPLDVFCAAVFVHVRDRGMEPALMDLRRLVLAPGAPMAVALEAWLDALRRTPGNSLIAGTRLPDDPRRWTWQAGVSILEQSGLTDRLGRIATCERALLERARTLESWKNDMAFAIDGLARQEIERHLPESRRMSLSLRREEAAPVPPVPEAATGPTDADSSDEALRAALELRSAMTSFEGGWHPSETTEGIPTIGFGTPDLERQARWIAEGWRTGWTPSGRIWAERYRSLLGDARVREFLRLGPSWIAGLRDHLGDPEPWTMAGWEDLLRWVYPAASRGLEIEFRQNQRPGSPQNRTGYDWTVLRLLALSLAEVVGASREPGLAPSCLVLVRNWQKLSRGRNLAPRSQEWWAWLTEEVDLRAEAEGARSFPAPAPLDDEWRMRHLAPWIAFPSPASASVLGAWATDPLSALREDTHMVHERWASRLSMLTQLQDEAKEEAVVDLGRRLG